MNCENCNKTLTGTFKFCPYCGGKVENDSPEALLKYIQTQRERIEAKGQDSGRWIKWEAWLKEVLKGNFRTSEPKEIYEHTEKMLKEF